jgi:hypothetical protein
LIVTILSFNNTVAVLISILLPLTIRFPVIAKSPLTVPPDDDSLVFDCINAPLAYSAAEFAVSNAGCTCGATLFAEINAALACAKEPFAYNAAEFATPYAEFA